MIVNDETSSDLRANIVDKRLRQCPDDKLLDKLSRKCTDVYKSLGRQLEVEHDRIEEISRDNVNYTSFAEKCFQVLRACKDSKGTEFTYEVLIKVLRNLDKNDLADKVRQHCFDQR